MIPFVIHSDFVCLCLLYFTFFVGMQSLNISHIVLCRMLLGFASVCEFSLLWMAAFDMAVLKQFMDASVFCLTYTYLGKWFSFTVDVNAYEVG